LTPAAWIALGSFAAFILVQTAIACLAIGGLFARINTLERTPRDDCKAELAAVNATMAGIKEAFERMGEDTGERFRSLETTVREYVMGSGSRRQPRAES
jgi:hypothetical protein